MNFWIVTDTHLGHGAIVEAGHRPAEFEKKILRGIDRMVQPDDVLIHLGDVAFTDPNLWVNVLRNFCKGKIWLCLGNHDRSARYYLKRGYDFVGDSLSLFYMGQKILFTHEPQSYDGLHDIQIHGHLHEGMHHAHEALPQHDRQISLFMEGHYSPYSLKHILKCHEQTRTRN